MNTLKISPWSSHGRHTISGKAFFGSFREAWPLLVGQLSSATMTLLVCLCGSPLTPDVGGLRGGPTFNSELVALLASLRKVLDRLEDLHRGRSVLAALAYQPASHEAYAAKNRQTPQTKHPRQKLGRIPEILRVLQAISPGCRTAGHLLQNLESLTANKRSCEYSLGRKTVVFRPSMRQLDCPKGGIAVPWTSPQD